MRSVHGFTVIEWLIVCAIVVVLAGLGLGIGSRAIENSRAMKCLGNLRSLGIALESYLSDHNQKMPTMEAARSSKDEDKDVIDTVLLPYVDQAKVFQCPSDPHFFKDTGTSYYWNSTLNGQAMASLNMLALVKELQRIPVFSDKEGWHRYSEDKVNVLYADGGAGRSLRFITGEK